MALESGLREFSWPIRVYYEDTDAAGIVYHANYLRFMERARTEWLTRIGYEQDKLGADAGIAFVVRRISIDYLRPARFNDEIAVVSRVLRHGRASLEFEQRVVAADELLSLATVKVGCVQVYSMRPTAMPPDVYMEVCNAC